MGLDMNLSRKTYVKNWEHQKPEEKHTITIEGPKKDLIKTERISHVEEDIMYWRKANAIHQFLLDGREDNCEEVGVPTRRIKELYDICERIIKECPLEDGVVNNGQVLINGQWVPSTEMGKIMTNQELAAKLLPTTSGFFFGSTDYDQWYYDDIVRTHKVLGELMQEPKWDYADYVYNASW